jgi:hypothetical protein
MMSLRQVNQNENNKDNSIFLVVAGPGGQYWKEEAIRFNAEKYLIYLGIIRKSEALQLQKNSSLIILIDPNINSNGWIPAKLYEYLFQDTAILAIGNHNSDVKKIVDETKRGIYVKDNAILIAEILKLIKKDPLIFKVKAQKDDINFYTREHQAYIAHREIKKHYCT